MVAYVKRQQPLIEIWQSCLRGDYAPGVNIKVVKPKDKNIKAGSAEFLRSAVKETLKYSVKPSDMTEQDPSWFLELTKQTGRKRMIATGGVLKNVLRVDDESNEDFILLSEDEEQEQEQEQDIELFFKYQKRHYYRDA